MRPENALALVLLVHIHAIGFADDDTEPAEQTTFRLDHPPNHGALRFGARSGRHAHLKLSGTVLIPSDEYALMFFLRPVKFINGQMEHATDQPYRLHVSEALRNWTTGLALPIADMLARKHWEIISLRVPWSDLLQPGKTRADVAMIEMMASQESLALSSFIDSIAHAVEVQSNVFAIAPLDATDKEVDELTAEMFAKPQPQSQGYLLQAWIDKFKFTSYLEIGCWKKETFNWMTVAEKICVDPVYNGDGADSAKLTSDDFFASDKVRPVDLVFIDGDHRWVQVIRDVIHALEYLRPGGFLVLHDTVPHNDLSIDPVAASQMHSNGDVFKAAVELRTWAHIDTMSCQEGGGITIVKKQRNTDRLRGAPNSGHESISVGLPHHFVYAAGITYKEFHADRHRFLRLRSRAVVDDWLASSPSEWLARRH